MTDFITVFAPGVVVALAVAIIEMLIKFIRGSRPGGHVDRIAHSAKAFDKRLGKNYKPGTWQF